MITVLSMYLMISINDNWLINTTEIRLSAWEKGYYNRQQMGVNLDLNNNR